MSVECVKADCFGRDSKGKCRILREALGDQGEGCPFYKTKKQVDEERRASDARLMELTGLTARDYVKTMNAYTESDARRYLDE